MVRTDQRYLADAGRRLDAITLHGTFGEALAFVTGYDAARASAYLGGFQRWLAARDGASPTTSIADLILAMPGVSGDEAKATTTLFALIEEYLGSRYDDQSR